MIKTHKIDLKSIISKNFPIEKVKDALEYPGKNPECAKVVVNS